ncbi:hypothetical protein MHYP_G00281270 [Metynnis hypsauchen]
MHDTDKEILKIWVQGLPCDTGGHRKIFHWCQKWNSGSGGPDSLPAIQSPATLTKSTLVEVVCTKLVPFELVLVCRLPPSKAVSDVSGASRLRPGNLPLWGSSQGSLLGTRGDRVCLL